MPWAGGANPLAYTNKVIALSPIAYWPMAESSGSVALDASGNGRDGAYTGVTLGSTGIGDGRTAAGYDGATSFGNVYSASLAAAFNGAELSVAIWGKVSAAGVWTDATSRRLFRLFADSNNYIEAYRTTTNGQLEIDYKAGGTVKGILIASGSPTGFFHLAVTVSKVADQAKFYFNGVQSGATGTGLGIFAGALAAASCLIGANTQTPTSVWSGTEAHMAVWATPLSGAQILSLATVP